ncbi:MAG TPA: hypothetical protein VLZ74_10135, partial [Methylocella sp.]|nr:hypothetical protein [Methylocella sp.]
MRVPEHMLARAFLALIITDLKRLVNRRAKLTPNRRPILTPSGKGILAQSLRSYWIEAWEGKAASERALR